MGGGAAGLATAIFAARRAPRKSVLILDGARKLGAKILVSGGGRCNVTNRAVTPADFWGGSRNVIRRALDAFPVARTIEFFAEIGVPLVEEPEFGKLFPVANRARAVLDALLREADRLGVKIELSQRVTAIEPANDRFCISTATDDFEAGRVVLATGGLSLPKTGSDGGGYVFAQRLGHSLTPTTPALVPLVLDDAYHAALSGIAHPAVLTIRATGEKPIRLSGPMLWTHFGISGPAALDASRHWLRARLENRAPMLTAGLAPDLDASATDARLLAHAAEHPRAKLRAAVAHWLPARVADTLLAELGAPLDAALTQIPREQRRHVAAALTDWPLRVTDSRGYTYAEVTAGGVPLSEIAPATMASRKQPGLYLVGEILDVDGRLGGFNFQWAWSSAAVAAAACVA